MYDHCAASGPSARVTSIKEKLRMFGLVVKETIKRLVMKKGIGNQQIYMTGANKLVILAANLRTPNN